MRREAPALRTGEFVTLAALLMALVGHRFDGTRYIRIGAFGVLAV